MQVGGAGKRHGQIMACVTDYGIRDKLSLVWSTGSTENNAKVVLYVPLIKIIFPFLPN